MNELFFALGCVTIAFPRLSSFFDMNRYVSERYSQSLVFTCFIELLRSSYSTMYLCGCGLYKNAYQNIRYALESIVQASYFDSNCPNDDFPMKVGMLEEALKKREYRNVRLIKKLHIDRAYKKDAVAAVEKEYRKLSRKVHSTHIQFEATAHNFMERSYSSVYVDCSEVSDIYDSMRTLYDIFFLLLLTHFPEIGKPLTENGEFVETIENHSLALSSKVLRT